MNPGDIKNLEGCISLAQYLREETMNPSPVHKVEAVIFVRRVPTTGVTDSEVKNSAEVSSRVPVKEALPALPSILRVVWLMIISMTATFAMDFLSLDEGFTQIQRDWAFLFGFFFLGIAACSTYINGVLHPSVLISLYAIFTFFPKTLNRRELFPYTSDIFDYILVDHFVWFHVKHTFLGIVCVFTHLNFEIKTTSKKTLKKE